MGEAKRRLSAHCRPGDGRACSPPSAGPWTLVDPSTEPPEAAEPSPVRGRKRLGVFFAMSAMALSLSPRR